ncbi:ATP-dependent DNA helicase PIF1 [Trametes pubescens]|uniref:ATP-dependent DNA helicase n=1 Tax=Trametes pubescens TaxID=154538 RepID=A0A1M2VIK7_TRAPU|nr:ATP-dependent DNA helicase PIF1 [Trametes pubescens]
MSAAALTDLVCAICGRLTPNEHIVYEKPGRINLPLLRNDHLPEHLLPTSYNREAYEGAILHPKGLKDRNVRGDLLVCNECGRDIKGGVLPKYSLANWLYYGHDELPSDVSAAFGEATQMERMLIARARASTISFKFSQMKGHFLYGTYPGASQSCIKGNVAIHPQDATHLNDVLPPGNDIIRDTVCAVFVGENKPTLDNIQALSPILVRKSRVQTMIQFLVANNQSYRVSDSFKGYSQDNMDALLGAGTTDKPAGVPCAMEIGHIFSSDAVSGATEGYVPGQDDPPESPADEMLIETVGYTDGDDSPLDNDGMRRKALAHCLRGGRFVQSQAGSRFVPDFENPELLSWLFPHLDPWGIGGFFRLERQRKLTLEQQLKYLLMVEGSPFRNDPDFAFIFYNIRQKKAVLDSVSFRVPESQRDDVVRQLLTVDVKTLDKLVARFESDPRYKPQDEEEAAIVRLLLRVNTVSHDLPGSNGYKVMLRNQIRALINFRGTPTLFVTLNPSDRDHPLVRLYAGHEVVAEDALRGEELSRWERTILAARNPAACARFFHKIISQFISTILRFGKSGRGLFGKCKAYYGTVEAQGRGTLHCHMLIWLEGHPSPQTLRDKLVSSDTYREQMFAWLESIIKCELPGTVNTVKENGQPLPRPKRAQDTGNPHPGSIPSPLIDAFEKPEDFETAFNAYVTELVQEFNWHEHNATCFKYVPGGTIPTDPNQRDALCRMRIDGLTCGKTCLDDETGALLLRRLHPRIASYNDLVIFLIKANMDIKFIGSGEAAKALLYYITDYITKPSLAMHDGLGALSYAIQRTNDKFPHMIDEPTLGNSRGALTIAVNRMLSRQEISHQQVMSYLVGGGDVYNSHTFRVLHWGAFDRLFCGTPSSTGRYDAERFVIDPIETGRGSVVLNTAGTDIDVDMPVNPESAVNDDVEMLDVFGIAPDQHDTVDTAEVVGTGERNDSVIDESCVLTLEKDGSISSTNQKQDYIYRSLDPVFEGMSLYEFVGMTDKEKLKPNDGGDDPANRTAPDTRKRKGRVAEPRGSFSSALHTQYASHRLRKRTIWTVPVILGERVPRPDKDPQEKEAWSRMMLILFIPWRLPSDLHNRDESWTNAFERQQTKLSHLHLEIISNMSVLSECRDARNMFQDMRRSEALALLSDGLPAGGHQGPGGFDESINQPFQLFDNSRHTDAHEYVHELAASQQVLDDTVGVSARELIDLCYGDSNSAGGSDAVLTGMSSLPPGDACSTRVRCAGDESSLLQQSATMRLLKRQRRPIFEENAGSEDGRPWKKRKISAVTENVTRATLAEVGEPTECDTEMMEGEEEQDPVRRMITQVVREMQLDTNPEQERSFRIVADHVHRGGEQLMMYIAGVGGTGKTHVVKAVLRLFELLGRGREILVGAPTGAAALNIDGFTVHSLMMMPSKSQRTLEELQKLWRPVKYLVIDEISMIGARFLADISKRLQQAKSNDGAFASLPFGGVNMIFTGDFGQLKPVHALTLYNHKLINKPGLQTIRNNTGGENLQGIYLWRQVKTVVKLKKNQRQLSDPGYAALLDRVRRGEARGQRNESTGDKSDADILYGRIMQHAVRDKPESVSLFDDAPIIVGTKALRDALNTRIITHKARRAGEDVMLFYSKDKIEKKPVEGELSRGLWKLPSNMTEDSLGHLPLFKGMRVMIRENLAFSKRLVNGAEGTIHNVLYEVIDGKPRATVAYVHVPGAGKITPELDEDIVPIFPESSSFKCTISVGGKKAPKTVSRLQLPLVPAYAYTDYKSQGKSLTRAIVDLASAHSLQGVYVMLSRVRSLEGLMILRPFSVAKVCARLSQELRDELDRIDRLDEATQEWFDAGRR